VAAPYVELGARSAFSFLEAASQPEALAERAAALGYPALALLDVDGVYGAARFYKAATEAGVRPLVGAALTLGDGARLPVLVETAEGYRNLCRLVTRVKFRAAKGKARARLDDLEGATGGLVCLTGGLDGPLAADLLAGRCEAARRTLDRLCGLFGRGRVYVELWRHRTRESELATRRALDLAAGPRLPVVATNGVRYATPSERLILDVFTAVRLKTTLDAAGRRLEPNLERSLKYPDEMARLFADQPAAVAETTELAARCGFTLKDLGYRFPDYPVPAGGPPGAYLRALTEAGARERYRPVSERVRRQLARELDLIERLDLAGYFLIVWDLVRECRARGILVQGRGSAANSAVCYSLGITAVDPVGMDLLFERFLSEERHEWPDIDLDLPSGDRREAIIQYVYDRYGRASAAMTANVITYQARRASREIGKVLGFPPDVLDRLSKFLPNFEYRDSTDRNPARHLGRVGLDPAHPRVRRFAELWVRVLGLPRHLGQHSGGLVLCAGRLDEIVPLEPATMPGRTVVQWDKDDCADMRLVKVDLLGLGMMAVLEDALVLCRDAGRPVDLAHLPPDDPAVYASLQQADTIGVFQVESRAQMATLPRLKPERFYDLVVEVAIIRPGPIVGDMVHPYLARRAGRAPVVYPHPSLEPILERTLGVPLFQEQLLRMAMVAAGFTGGEAEELRRALGFRRSEARMKAVETKLRAGIARNGITGESAEAIVRSITSFAEYGFPECVVGETRVLDAETGRRVRIDDVAAGRERISTTLACDSRLRLRKRRVLGARASGPRMVHRLRTALGREILATKEHPLLTMSGWRSLGGLRAGDHIAAARGLPGLGRKSWPRLTWSEVAHQADVSVRALCSPDRAKRGYRRWVIARLVQTFDSVVLGDFAESDLYWDRITSIEPVGVRETYDLQIEGDHNFLANDLVVHNSHAASFALLAYASAYLKVHHPAQFYAAILNNQPMGFYAPATLVKDAQRHGQPVRSVDVTRSDWLSTVEDGAVRLGFMTVKGFREASGRRLVETRRTRPFESADDLMARAQLSREELLTLAEIGALDRLGLTRRGALWEAERAARPAGPLWAGRPVPPEPSPLREMTTEEELVADYRGMALTVGPHPLAFRRAVLARRGVTTAAGLAALPDGARVRVAGQVIVRQRPGTAKGFVFLSLEDETGVANAIVRPALFERERAVIVHEPFVLVEGLLQHQDGVRSIRARHVRPLAPLRARVPSHDFR
jgi:error-prone DNA polymerase